MKYVFDPKILHEVALAHLELPLEEKFTAIAQNLAERYPGLIETEPEWFFSNAGGVMGQLTVLYASLREYVIFFGSPIGGEGHTGRYSFVEDHAIILDGEFWYYTEGDTRRTEYRPGDVVYLPKAVAKGYRIVNHGWILEYARGPIPTMLPYGIADTAFSTLDYRTLFRTFRIYIRHLMRSARKRPAAHAGRRSASGTGRSRKENEGR